MRINEPLRREMQRKGVFQYRVAALLGVSEGTLIRWLRMPLGEDRETAIRLAIAKAVREKETEGI